MKLIVAIDGEESAKTALKYILNEKYTSDTEIHLIHVIVPGFADCSVEGIPDVVQEEKMEEQTVLDHMSSVLNEALNIKASTEILSGYTADTIAEACNKYGADLVIVASHPRHGLSRLWCGSVADEIVDASPCTVVVLKMNEEGALIPHGNRA